MAHQVVTTYGVNVNPPPPVGTSIGIVHSPHMLSSLGLNLLVELSTASAYLKVPEPPGRKTLTVFGHVDTGASVTTIGHTVAKHLDLAAIGTMNNNTAGGMREVPTYALDIAFVGSPLRGIQNLRVSSCELSHYQLPKTPSDAGNPNNFGLLIGRDLLALWSMVWHGPTSTVFIAD